MNQDINSELDNLNNRDENIMDYITDPDFIKEEITLNQPKEMEVHHAHHPSHKKKWNEYLLEFLMLFLAVYLGFLAENYREHKIEGVREKEYMETLVNDLKSDSKNLDIVISAYKDQIAQQDTLLVDFQEIEEGFNIKLMKRLSKLSMIQEFFYTDATIQQLKNSGNFRLVKNKNVVSKILNYDSTVKSALSNELNATTLMNEISKTEYQLLNIQGIRKEYLKDKTPEQLQTEKFDVLFTHNEVLLNTYFNQIQNFKLLCRTIMEQMMEVRKLNIALIPFIKNEYGLKK